MIDAVHWREDPVRVKQWLLGVMRQCRQARLPELAIREHIWLRAEVQGIPRDVLQTSVQLLTLEEEAEAAFRRLGQDLAR